MADGGGKADRARRGLGALVQRGVKSVGKLNETVREIRSGSVLEQAIAARQRGNLPAAFWLAHEAHESAPDDGAAAVFYWEVAVERGRHREALSGMLRAIEHDALDDVDTAAERWCDVSELEPEARAHPTALTRLLPVLEKAEKAGGDEVARDSAARALLHALEAIADSPDLEASVALRAVSFAKERNAPCAARLAEKALESPHLHEVKRVALQELLSELTDAGPEPISESPRKSEAERPEEPAPAAALEALVEVDEEEEPPVLEEVDVSEDAFVDEDDGVVMMAELVGDDVSVDMVCEAVLEEDEDPLSMSNPAENHPLYTDAAVHEPLSEDEVEAMRANVEAMYTAKRPRRS